MQDAFAYCAELVRTADRDRFIASLFAPAEQRDALHALYAFNIEVTRVREVAREALPGEIRLQWWRDVIDGERAEEASANPVAAVLLAVIARHQLAAATFGTLIEAHRFDLYDEPMTQLTDLGTYARHTSSALIGLASQILGGGSADAAAMAAGPAGIASAIAGLLRAFPVHAARRQLYVPIALLDSHGVEAQDVFAGQSSSGLKAVFAELRDLARQQLQIARQHVIALPRETLSAFLPVALVRPSLDRLERCEPFAPREISPWRRQWLIWRAARNPARIAG
jgi:phytoene synthase